MKKTMRVILFLTGLCAFVVNAGVINLHAQTWSETTFTDGTFSNTTTTTGSAEVILAPDPSHEGPAFIYMAEFHSLVPRTDGTLWGNLGTHNFLQSLCCESFVW